MFNTSRVNNLKRTIHSYLRGKFRSDLSAGLTVAMVVIPQAMAYAAIAGINPIYGLFTAIIPTIIAALFGSFPFLITGPTNPTALVTASVLIVYANRPDYLEYVLALAIVAGIFKILFGLLKLGTIARYISNSVLVGFLTGVGVLIIFYQLGNLFGIELPRVEGLWDLIKNLFTGLSRINIFATAISLLSIFSMVILRKINRRLPAALITIVVSTLLVYLTGWGEQQYLTLVSDFGLPERISLSFYLPKISLNNLTSLIIPGAAVALFGFVESISIAKSMSQMSGTPFNPSKEMFGQGLASFVGGFFRCMPSAGSPSRTVINVVNGAKTRLAAIISGLSVFIFLVLFSGLIGYIPIAALAAIVIVSSAGLININLIKLTWQSRLNSRVVMVITFVSTLVLPLEYAIYLGILTTILIFLGESSHTNLSYIVEAENGQFIEKPMNEIREQAPRIAIVNIEGDLYFGAVEDLQNQIEKILETDLRVLILRFRRTHLLASTGIMALDQLIRTARKKRVKVLFCGIREEVLEPLMAAGVTTAIGQSNVFIAQNQLFESTQHALAEAKRMLDDEDSAKEAKNK